jgi:hypothetical protein
MHDANHDAHNKALFSYTKPGLNLSGLGLNPVAIQVHEKSRLDFVFPIRLNPVQILAQMPGFFLLPQVLDWNHNLVGRGKNPTSGGIR